MQLSLRRNDLPVRQSPLARAAEAGAHQKAAVGSLGIGSRADVSVGAPEPADSQIRPEHDLHRRAGTWRTRDAVACVDGGDVFGGLSRQKPGPRGAEEILPAILVSRRHRQPLHTRDARVDPRGRRAGLQLVARLWGGVRQSGPDRDVRCRRWRGGDGTAGNILAEQQISEPGARRRGAAGAPSERLQDCQSDNHGTHATTGTGVAVPRIWMDAAFRRRRRSAGDASPDGGYAGALYRGDSDDPAGGARRRQADGRNARLSAMADDRAAHAEGLDRTEGSGWAQGGRILARAPGTNSGGC